MEYNEVREMMGKIIKSIKKGTYKISIDEANNIRSCTAPNGRTFYKVVDMDGVKSSNDFGTFYVEVEGYSFSCDLGTGEYESDFFDEMEEEYTLDDDTTVEKDELIDELIEVFNSREDIWFGEYAEMDWQMEIYAQFHNIKDPEYYWCEDSDCPVDIDDDWYSYTAPKDLGIGTVYYNHRKYYLVEDPTEEDGEQLHAVHCQSVPDDQGLFPTVLLTMEYKKNGKKVVVECEECDEQFNAAEGYIE